MRCAQCSKNLDDSMTFALENNVCPYCGGALTRKEIISKLTEVLTGIRFSKNVKKQEVVVENIVDVLLKNFVLSFPGEVVESKAELTRSLAATGSSAPAASKDDILRLMTSVLNEDGDGLMEGTAAALRSGTLEGKDSDDLIHPEAQELADDRLARLKLAAKAAEKRLGLSADGDAAPIPEAVVVPGR